MPNLNTFRAKWNTLSFTKKLGIVGAALGAAIPVGAGLNLSMTERMICFGLGAAGGLCVAWLIKFLDGDEHQSP